MVGWGREALSPSYFRVCTLVRSTKKVAAGIPLASTEKPQGRKPELCRAAEVRPWNVNEVKRPPKRVSTETHTVHYKYSLYEVQGLKYLVLQVVILLFIRM